MSCIPLLPVFLSAEIKHYESLSTVRFNLFWFIVACNLLYRSYHDGFKDRGNQYIQLVKILHCKLLGIGKQLSTFPSTLGSGV